MTLQKLIDGLNQQIAEGANPNAPVSVTVEGVSDLRPDATVKALDSDGGDGTLLIVGS